MPSLADQFMQDAGTAASGGSSLSAQFASDVSAPNLPTQNKPSERSALQEVGRQIALTGRAGITGIMSVPNMVGDAVNTAINLGVRGVNKVAGTNIKELELPSQATQNLMNIAGVPQPENGSERVAQATASSMAGVAPSVALGKLLSGSAQPVVQAVGKGLEAVPGMQVLGAGGAGLGSSTAGEAGAGPVGQILAGIGGAALGAGAGTVVSRIAASRSGAAKSSPVVADSGKNEVQPANMAKPRLKLNIDGTTQELTQPVPSFSSPADAAPSVATQGAAPTVSNTVLPKTEQMRRIATLQALGLDEQRPSSYTGDGFQGAQEFQTSKLDSPVGHVLRNQLAKEQEALRNFASNIVESTGGAAGADPVARGTAITTPLKGLSDHFDQQIKSLYSAADQAAGGAQAIKLDGLDGILKTNSVFAGKAENSALRRGIRAYLKEQGISGGAGDGSTAGLRNVSVQEAEGLRQYLNSQWSPQSSGLIGKIKEALDLDVTKAAGSDVYNEARSLHALRKNTLDNPKGIAGILQEEGPGGINRQIPLEHVASRTINMPAAQFKHVIDTLKKMPTPDLQEQANQAVNEIRRQMAESIYAAGAGNGKGSWNASAVTKALNSMRPKLSLVFSTDELNQLRILNDGGHILSVDRSYPGAAAQGYNMIQSGAIKLGPAVGTAIGSVSGSPAAGYMAGKGASSMIQGWADKNNAAKLAELLRQPSPK